MNGQFKLSITSSFYTTSFAMKDSSAAHVPLPRDNDLEDVTVNQTTDFISHEEEIEEVFVPIRENTTAIEAIQRPVLCSQALLSAD